MDNRTTTLPAAVPARSGRGRRWLLVVPVVVVVAGGVLALLLTGGSSSTATRPVAARVQGKVPKAAVFAASNTVTVDAAGVLSDARSLLAGRLTPVTLTAAVRDALTHPPSPGETAPTLGPALALDDPQLPSCLAGVTGGATLFGLDRISYAGAPSLLVVAADSDSASEAFAYVIGTGCAAPGTGIRTVVTVPL